MNFYNIVTETTKNGTVEVYPDFQGCDEDSDLMIRGNKFYAIWNEEAGLWSRNEYDVQKVVDRDLYKKKVELENAGISSVKVKSMKSYRTKSWETYKSYVSKMPDRFVALDDKLTFLDTVVEKSDYVSKRLQYTLKKADHAAYDELMDILYAPEERQKIEWAIGSIISGDSRKIEKFYVLYGKGGTGKGSVLRIIEKLFDGYVAAFNAQALSNSNESFSMESFSINPLVAIDPDGVLNRIDDATRINSIVSHEKILMNEKGKPHYPYVPHCVLFIGSNEPVKIKDEESGLIRRLIDIQPKSKKTNPIPGPRYNVLMSQIGFELGGIAYHCLQVYKKLGRHAYDNYRPQGMIYRTNPFFNFILNSYDAFCESDGVTLKTAYMMWTNYCNECGLDSKKMPRHVFGSELMNYFDKFDEITRVDGRQIRSWYSGFKRDMVFSNPMESPSTASPKSEAKENDDNGWLDLTKTESLLEEMFKNCKAQYEEGMVKWDNVKTKLSDIDTKKTHYFLPPDWILMVDFDLKNQNGEKDKLLNIEAANKWPKTYAEFSKSGCGIHLYYRYTGDLNALLDKYAKDIELKVFRGKAPIRRRLSYCNDIQVATISGGLPTKPKKEETGKKMISVDAVEFERYLYNCINKALRKEVDKCPSTKQSCNYIKYILDEAYNSGKHYDVSSARKSVYGFAMNSTNNARYCTDLVRTMKWMSKDASEVVDGTHKGVEVVFDCEVFPNVNFVNWKVIGYDTPIIRWINPTPAQIEQLLEYDLFGFYCRKYDNHILHAMRLGYSPQKIYERSKLLVGTDGDGYFRDAWDYSKGDIYDYSSKKKSLKWFEIELGKQMEIKMRRAKELQKKGVPVDKIAADPDVDIEAGILQDYLTGKRDYRIHHMELNLDWDEPVPEDQWPRVAEYCDNDVLATEALWMSKERQADWNARKGLAILTGLSTNQTTNTHTEKLIFGDDPKPQTQFNYRNLAGDESDGPYKYGIEGMDVDTRYTVFDNKGRPVFPGYERKKLVDPDDEDKKEKWVSMYRDVKVGEGGYVYGSQQIWTDVALLDIESMHPSSVRAEMLFGPKYTPVYGELVDARLAIKHKDYDKARKLFGGKLAPYLNDPKEAKMLAGALKIAINAVYGLTAARYPNKFRDPRNNDNIVAKRGALFMVNLKNEVERRGYVVAHIKTDSIKIPNATPEIIKFVKDYGKAYGYNFEHEATYERMCLTTNADYVARYEKADVCMQKYGYVPSDNAEHGWEWTEVGDRFLDTYVFKSLITHEPIVLEDMFEVNTVSTAIYLDMNENLSTGDHNYVFVGKCGAFCPVLPGCGGGYLVRKNKDKYDKVNDSKNYRWKEYEIIRDGGLEQQVDRSYYDQRVKEAKAEIEQFAPIDVFISDEPFIKHEKLPWED